MGYSHGVCGKCHGTGRRVVQREDEPEQRFGDRLFLSEIVECWSCGGKTTPAPTVVVEQPRLNLADMNLLLMRQR